MTAEGNQPPRPGGRLLSLDAFRGLTVAAMVLVNNAGTRDVAFLRHATWHGLTLADAVFPTFLFIVGVSLTLSSASTRDSSHWVRRLLVRTSILFGLGMLINVVYSLAARTWAVSFTGVLQRIALSALIAAPFARRRASTALAAGLLLLAVHSVLLLYVPFPGGSPGEVDRPQTTIAAWVDRTVLDARGLEPENLLGTLSSAGGVLLGVAAGWPLMRRDERGAASLAGYGILALAAGVALSPWLPVNKRLWTATFVLVVTGLDLLLLAAAHWAVDLRGHLRLAGVFEPLGRNALAIYVASTLLDGVLLAIHLPGGSAFAQLQHAFTGLLGPVTGVLAFGLAMVLLWYAVAVAMYRRGLFIRL